jgi:hypothetical protein
MERSADRVPQPSKGVRAFTMVSFIKTHPAKPRLLPRHGVLATGMVMGVLWGAWHFPLFAGSAAASGPVPPALLIAALLFAWLPPYRILMVWVYDHTQSLLLMLLMHLAIVVNQ